MARAINRLSARTVQTLRQPGRHADGNGLYLVVREGGAKSWCLIININGKRRELGLGPVSAVTLADARVKRDEALRLRQEGLDPQEVWGRASKDAAAQTFGPVALEFISSQESGWKNEKHRKQWRSTLETYAAPIWDKPIAEVDENDILAILKPIWMTRPETARRVRARIERVLNAAKWRKLRAGENPAQWRGGLEHWLPAQKSDVKHHDAMPYDNVSEFYSRLTKLQATSADALRFTILTAARTGETLGATWKEFDLENALWIIPGSRMKEGKEHRVPLSSAALALLEGLEGERKPDDYLFPGSKPGKPLSNMAMLMLLRRMNIDSVTVHGFRSAFRDWAGDTQLQFPREIVEQALSHAVGSEVERAYRRGDALEKRRELINVWANYVTAPTPAAGHRPDNARKEL
ncbi:tyrosine-type recombinase/integrase [Sphingomonas segetis]|uniref:tyrosine-type recombinase/integrase n=1 Tax=Sphingomonas segetis TaxID=1104779 RepID=UPI0012D34A91|nr:site-specific integrase [Sphingomonas segetis]